MNEPILQIEDLVVQINTDTILDQVNLNLYPGEALGIIGRNGSGKSTLVSVLSGERQPSSGCLYLAGEKVNLSSPAKAIKYGVATLYQTVNLVPELTVAENIFIGHWPKNRYLQVDRKKMKQEAQTILQSLDPSIVCSAKVSSLCHAQKRTVELAKAMSMKAKILILDEPCISYTGVEIKALQKTLTHIKSLGVAIILISHQIEYVLELCNQIAFMSDNNILHYVPREQLTSHDIVKSYFGVKDSHIYPKIPTPAGRPILKFENLSSIHLDKINLQLHKHEIVGLLGASLSDYYAVGNVLLGQDPILEGNITINGQQPNLMSNSNLKHFRIGYISDNQCDNLFPNLNISQNITITNLSRRKFFDYGKDALSDRVVKALSIKVPDSVNQIAALSLGNQQKVRLGQCLLAACQVYIIEEPTASIDVPSKIDVYNYIMNLAIGGSAFLLISTNVKELLGMCDRIVILKDGKIDSIIKRKDFSQTTINNYIFDRIK